MEQRFSLLWPVLQDITSRSMKEKVFYYLGTI